MEKPKPSKKIFQTKKIFEDILNNYKNSLVEINNLKDLFSLASQENNSEILEDCNSRLDEIYTLKKKVKSNVSYLEKMTI